MIKKEKHLKTINNLFKTSKIVGLLGARQVGKTTLARMFVKKYNKPSTFFDLENPEDLARLQDPMLALKELSGLVILDEIQRKPDIFPVLRVLTDKPNSSTRYLILGSASPNLLKQSSETLAGRIIYYYLSGISLTETGTINSSKLWLRGGFPRSYTANSLSASLLWRKNFIKTFLERDLPQLGITINATTMRRFWTMLANYHGQVWNASDFGRSFGVADTTVRSYLDILTSALVIRQLLPWTENIRKRQVKSPKIYIGDSGLLHALLNLKTITDIESHPKLGSSWEGFLINEIMQQIGVDNDECFFWATHSGAELDLLVVKGRKKYGYEIKHTSSPKITPSMLIALKDLNLDHLFIIHAGEKTFQPSAKITAVPHTQILKVLKPLP